MVVALALILALLLALAVNRQGVFAELHLDVVLPEARQLGADDEPIAVLQRLNAGRPYLFTRRRAAEHGGPSEHAARHPSARSQSETTEDAIERLVHFSGPFDP